MKKQKRSMKKNQKKTNKNEMFYAFHLVDSSEPEDQNVWNLFIETNDENELLSEIEAEVNSTDDASAASYMIFSSIRGKIDTLRIHPMTEEIIYSVEI